MSPRGWIGGAPKPLGEARAVPSSPSPHAPPSPHPPSRSPQPAGGMAGGGVDDSWEAVDAALGGDPARRSAPIKTLKDKYELLPAFLKVGVGQGEGAFV